MASLVLSYLLLLAAASESQIYRHLGASLSFSHKGKDLSGTYEVEIRYKPTGYENHENSYKCSLGDCGMETQSNTVVIGRNSVNLTWHQVEVVSRRKLNTNLPFQITYPNYYNFYYKMGYWIENPKGWLIHWKMMTNIDLGTRSDTGESNRPPVTTTLPIIRVTKYCPRTFSLTVFDPDGDRVRCRVPVTRYNNIYDRCSLCSLDSGFSIDENSCSVTYNYTEDIGYHPIELVVEDFPNQGITVSYSDRSYTTKRPLSTMRRKRQATPYPTTTTTAPTTNAFSPTTTTAAPTTNVFYPTTTTAAPTTNVFYPTTTTAAPTTNAFNPTTTTAAPTTNAFNPTTTTAAPTTNAPFYRSSFPSLSRIPLDFTVYVDNHIIPSCLDGDYFPIFLAPTPANGVNLPAFVNQTLKVKVRSTAQYATIRDLLVTGPQRISKEKVSRDSYIITWTPTDFELHDHFPICFVSEAEDGQQRVFHSELRCVTVSVERHDATVTCNETTITVELAKSSLIKRKENHLHLIDGLDSSCSLRRHSNVTHLVAVIPLNGCGTRVEEDDDNIIFENMITSADPNKIISRHQDIEIVFSCAYPKRANLTLGFTHKNPYAFRETGFGAFTFQFEFFESERFIKQVDASSYPVEVYLKQMIFMQIEVTSSIPNTELFVESCRATPYDNPNSRISYTIIENGCKKDGTVQIYNSSESQFRFGMEAFEFIGHHDEVYITCSVIMCETGVPGTRCSQGCIRSNSLNNRKKRDASAETSSHFISQGPLRLARTKDTKATGPSLSLGLNLVFIVGCLLACSVVVYRSRRAKAKYQPLATSETD